MRGTRRILLVPVLGAVGLVSYAVLACSGASTATAPGGTDAATDETMSDGASTGDSGSQDAPTSSADSGGDIPECDPAHPGDCASDEYCALTNCAPGTGVCTPRPAESNTDLRIDLCGCDGLFYWNETIAGSRGESVQDRCIHVTPCGGAANTKCPAGSYCQYPGSCDSTIAQDGRCWALPTTCETIVGSWSECGAEAGAPATCTNLCVVTKNEKPFGGSGLGTCN
jgi:hypothetical protein